MLTLSDIQAAQDRLRPLARVTPLLPLPEPRGETAVFLKLESLQYTGSFKIRGAANCLALLGEEARGHGVMAASAGNHAQGVAAAARYFGLHATIVMPAATPLVKVDRTRRHGAHVILKGASFEEAYAEACSLAASTGATFIHPFADERVMAGQGTVALEVLQQAPELESVVVPVGGGGLIAGIATAVKALRPEVRVFGVQAEVVAPLARSLPLGRLTPVPPALTIAEGIAVAAPAQETFELIRRYVDDIVTVSEAELATAMLDLLEDDKLVVEGAGAAPYAALPHLQGRLGRRSVLVLSGGNADVTTLGAVIDRGLAFEGRTVRLRVDLHDHPGTLAKLAEVLGSAHANIIEIFHNRTTGNLVIGQAQVEVVLSTRGPEHVHEILQLLQMKGYDARERE